MRRAPPSVAVLLSLLYVLLSADVTHAQRPGAVIVVGDSLQVESGSRLERELGGEVAVDARRGRTSGEGLRVLRDRLRPRHRAVVFDLGTNDDPSRPGGLRATLAAAREVAGERCLVVATLVRPPVDGVRIDGMNRVLERFAARNRTVRLADWAAAAQSSPGVIRRDRVHATREGYAQRARIVAAAVRSCSQELAAAPPNGARAERQPARLGLASGGVVPRLVELLPLELPLGVLRAATGLVEGALRQAQGTVVPIAPDAVLGREGDPLGKRSP